MSVSNYVEKISNPVIKEKLEKILTHLEENYPELVGEIKWSKPMFSKDGTFILGFDASKKHLSVIPEPYCVQEFQDTITEAGYAATSNLFKILENQEVNFALLDKIIDFKLEDKKGDSKFFK